ncbi:unnamed protein product [Paramecium sonneborni]|uniref:CSC1/OSCA1-like 7TM region domain-containing protein n=1 Tax=Paramecium sonneborni TaxID=65129 RepID=A0A8S1KI42_9CILI|nr:unnamed protein product [Paramecium sonneborni]
MQYEESDYYLLLGSSIFINITLIAITIFLWKVIWLQYPIFIDEFQIKSLSDAYNIIQIANINLIINQCGFDGLTLLLFEQKLFVGLSYYTIVYFLIMGICKISWNYLNDYQKLFVQLNILPNQDFIISSMLLLVIFAMLIQLRKELQIIYIQMFTTDQFTNYSIRTLHIRGMDHEDYDGVMMMLEILKYLDEVGDPGTIMGISIIPEYSKLLELEKYRSLFKYQLGILELQKPLFYPLPNISIIEEQIDQQLQKPFKLSGHCFICVDRLQTQLKLCNQNTLTQYQIQLAPDLFDINWVNITIESNQIRIWRTIILNLLIMTLLIFVTSPQALYQYLSKFPGLEFLSFKWTILIPDPFGRIIKNNIPPIILISINQIILYFLDVITQAEKHERWSQYHISFFHKMFFYLILNVLVIPAFLLQSSETLFNITYNGFNIQLQKAFDNQTNYGLYYITFLFYSGTGAFLVELIRPSELYFNYFSSYMAYYMRLYENDAQHYQKSNEFCVQYGYISAQMLLNLTIICIFNTTSPFVLIAGLWFFGFRYIGDFFMLMVSKQEMVSNGKYLYSLLQLSCFTLGLWLIVKVIGCYFQSNYLMMYLFGIELIAWTKI